MILLLQTNYYSYDPDWYSEALIRNMQVYDDFKSKNFQYQQFLYRVTCWIRYFSQYTSSLLYFTVKKQFKHTVRYFNCQNAAKMSLGCWVRHVQVPKHVWTCPNIRLHELQTNWVISSQAAEEPVPARGILLVEEWMTRIWSSGYICIKFCV
jgi:hypothetical protein